MVRPLFPSPMLQVAVELLADLLALDDGPESVRELRSWLDFVATSPALPGETVHALVEWAGGEQPVLSHLACEALGRTDEENALASLLEAFSHPLSRVRAALCAGLGNYTDPRALEALAMALQDVHAAVRRKAILALTRHAGPVVVPRLRECLEDPDGTVRKAAKRAIRLILERHTSGREPAMGGSGRGPEGEDHSEREPTRCRNF